MGTTKETAEEQLLRMIEGPGGHSPPPDPVRRFSRAQLAGQWHAGLETMRRWALPTTQPRLASDLLLWRLQLAQRVFAVALVGFGCYLVVDLFFLRPHPPFMGAHAHLLSAGGPHRAVAAAPEVQLKPLAEYQQALVTRNPFGVATSQADHPSEDRASKSRLTAVTSVLTVVGINRGRVPEALIEDGTAQRTYVVKVGDQVNGVIVKSIDQNGVVVTLDGEETLLP